MGRWSDETERAGWQFFWKNSASTSKNRVFTSVGDTSRLLKWLEDDKGFDLWTSYYGKVENRYRCVGNYCISNNGGTALKPAVKAGTRLSVTMKQYLGRMTPSSLAERILSGSLTSERSTPVAAGAGARCRWKSESCRDTSRPVLVPPDLGSRRSFLSAV